MPHIESSYRELARHNGLVIYTYDSGDIFVNDTRTNVVMRIGRFAQGLIVTGSGFQLSPFALNSAPAFRIY